MELRRPPVADPTAHLPSVDAVAKLGAASVVMLAAFLSRDPLTPALLLAGVALTLPLAGLPAADLARRVVPLLAAAALLGALNAVFSGPQIGTAPATVADRVAVGTGLGLRVAVIALAGVLAVASTDPADLASGLVGHLRMSPRLAVGALAALRLVPVLADEWRTIRLARRARGVDAGRNPVAALRLAVAALVTLLVSAIRRATRLALAMDARGFGRGPRTMARPPRMRARDWRFLAAAIGLAGGAVAISLAAGSWTFVFA